jgi:hypothetical protein
MNMTSRRCLTLVVMLFISGAALAQSGPGMGGPGMGGAGGGWKQWKWDADTVPGWQLMTPEERSEHQKKMRSVKTFDECEAYHQQHRGLMEQRAKEKGVTLATPRRDPCDMMKARGIIK